MTMPGRTAGNLTDAQRILGSLPCGRFTTADFLTCAISLNAIGHCNDVVAMLGHLSEVGSIRALDVDGTWLRTGARCGPERLSDA
ncbi:MAG: hypothetical protein HZB15_04605 [Actinobacteria bacterium]|nr:hypothetical protein [Actinomycetota bacterium]